MHPAAYQFIQTVVGALQPRRRVLEIGSRNINGSVRELFPGTCYLGIDTVEGPGVDETADGAHFTARQPFDTVVCCEVLEHTESAAGIIANGLRLLDREGALLVTCAAPPREPHSSVDGGPLRPGEYYQNVNPKQLRWWVESHGGTVQMLSYIPAQGDLYLWAEKPASTRPPLLDLDGVS